jgi:dipeptidyl aminopeptidase/acylaminoacyl peptidase
LRAVLLLGALHLATAEDGVFAVRKSSELDLGSVEAWSPKWSPDGQWIAFSLPKSEGIGRVRPDGSELRILTREPRSGYRFAWSPDGSQIAYRVLRPEAGPRRYSIRAIDLAGNPIAESEVLPDLQPPQWEGGPGGTRWVAHDGKRRIEGQWNSISGSPRASAATPPLVLPREGGVWIDFGNGAPGRKLTEGPAIRPAWDRSGRRVLFDATDRILAASTDEAEPARLLCVGQHPAWSPDGEWVLFQITRDHSHAPGDDRQHSPDMLPHLHNDKTNHQIVDSELWVIHRDGTQRHQLTNTPDVLESDPDWSVDGKSIVCRDERTGRLRILEVSRQ